MKRYMNEYKPTDEAGLFGRILYEKPCAGFSIQHDVKLNDEKKRVYLVA